jgi:hypothetical protein
MSLYCGIDLHSNNCYLAVLDDQLQRIRCHPLPAAWTPALPRGQPSQEPRGAGRLG